MTSRELFSKLANVITYRSKQLGDFALKAVRSNFGAELISELFEEGGKLVFDKVRMHGRFLVAKCQALDELEKKHNGIIAKLYEGLCGTIENDSVQISDKKQRKELKKQLITFFETRIKPLTPALLDERFEVYKELSDEEKRVVFEAVEAFHEYYVAAMIQKLNSSDAQLVQVLSYTISAEIKQSNEQIRADIHEIKEFLFALNKTPRDVCPHCGATSDNWEYSNEDDHLAFCQRCKKPFYTYQISDDADSLIISLGVQLKEQGKNIEEIKQILKTGVTLNEHCLQSLVERILTLYETKKQTSESPSLNAQPNTVHTVQTNNGGHPTIVNNYYWAQPPLASEPNKNNGKDSTSFSKHGILELVKKIVLITLGIGSILGCIWSIKKCSNDKKPTPPYSSEQTESSSQEESSLESSALSSEESFSVLPEESQNSSQELVSSEEHNSSSSNEEISPAPIAFAKEKTSVLKKYGDSLKITDSGWWGLNHGYDTLNLSDYTAYLSSDYIFCFELILNLKEVNEGYQEVYLYNRNDILNEEMSMAKAEKQYGLICGSVISHPTAASSAEHYVNWYVRGDEFHINEANPLLYIRYDAYGNGDDTWIRNSIQVNLSVVTAPSDITNNNALVCNNADEKTITHNGFYGLGNSKFEYLFEDIDDLSAYEQYKNESYLFLFSVSLDLHEKNLGWQEVFLYNAWSDKNADSLTLAQARNEGLIDQKMLYHSTGTTSDNHQFVFAVTGDKISDKMYIRYDAFGDNVDTWVKENIQITMTIVRIPEYTTDIKVTDAYKKFNEGF